MLDWIKHGADYYISYGTTREELSPNVYLKQSGDLFWVADYLTNATSPHFGSSIEAKNWYNEVKNGVIVDFE